MSAKPQWEAMDMRPRSNTRSLVSLWLQLGVALASEEDPELVSEEEEDMDEFSADPSQW